MKGDLSHISGVSVTSRGNNNNVRYQTTLISGDHLANRTPDTKLHKVMSTKTNVRGSSVVGSEGIENYLDTQSIGVGLDGTLRLLGNDNDASTKKGDGPDEDLIPHSRMSNMEQ